MKIVSIFYCFLYAVAGIKGAEINVEGFEGGEVSFRCSHKLAWKNNKYFCNDPCKSSRDILVTVQSGGRAGAERITLVDSGDGASTVTFSQLQLSDTGRYLCGVDRPGFDTYTSVQLTVKEAVPHPVVTDTVVANETTTVIPTLEPELLTWTYQNISNPTQLTSGIDTSRPANHSTASNSTNGGAQNISRGIVLYATAGVVAILTIVMLAVIVWKCSVKSKPQPQVCSNSIGADEGEDDCEYDDIGGEVLSIKKISEKLSCTHHPKQDPPTSATTANESSTPHHIYENICCSKGTAHSRCSAANNRDKREASSKIYINPLPPSSERTVQGCLKPTATTSSSTSKASAFHSRSRRDSTEVRPTSLWFGLDLSGTV